MRPLFKTLLMGCAIIYAETAAAQTFNERWSIIPKANAKPVSQPDEQIKPEAPTDSQTPSGRPSQESSGTRPTKRVFSGKASYYSYASGKTASGAPFKRNALTAAHRTLPFGTKVRVTDPMTRRSVVVIINDRGPSLRNRVLDLSLGAARTLGMTDRGVVHVRAEVL